MKERTGWFSWLVLFFFAGVLSSAYFYSATESWPTAARIFPWAGGLTGLVLAVIELLTPRVPFLSRYFRATRVMDLVFDRDAAGPPGSGRRKVRLMMAWLCGLLAGIYLFGFPVAVAAFLYVFLTVDGRVGQRRALTFTACVCLIVFVLFGSLMHVPWPEPALLSWYKRLT